MRYSDFEMLKKWGKEEFGIDKGHIFRRSRLHVMLGGHREKSFKISKILLSHGPVYLYSDFPVSIEAVLDLWQQYCQSLDFYYYNSWFRDSAWQDMVEDLIREERTSSIVIEIRSVRQEHIQSLFNLLYRGHLIVFVVEEWTTDINSLYDYIIDSEKLPLDLDLASSL